ncbi:transaldolase, partial [Algiphilus sp. NNCM1]|nr:transaldolase [Algiphilus acroporae]
TTTDVRNATDIFREIAEATDFVDGRVSIEVDPRLAHETEATEQQAVELWEKVNRPNAMIKIPATLEGLPAITATLAKGISVNVTLIFSLERYEQVIDAFIEGIAQADANGHDLKHIGSVASFFVSRVDTAVDNKLEEIGSDEAKA